MLKRKIALCDRDLGKNREVTHKNIFWRVITKSKKCYIKDTPYVCLIVLPRPGNRAGIFLFRHPTVTSCLLRRTQAMNKQVEFG